MTVLVSLCDIAASAISDPYFSGNLSSWMSFSPANVRYKTHLQMQFQTLSQEGIMFYMAQHLTAKAGKSAPDVCTADYDCLNVIVKAIVTVFVH